MVFGISLFCGGSLSNLFDRITSGGVVDFLNIGIPGLRPYIFNLADVAIAAGGILFLLVSGRNFARAAFRENRQTGRQQAPHS